jgi:hypothetical protein
MEPLADTSPRIARAYVLVTLGVLLLWQCWTLAAMCRFTPAILGLWRDLGIEAGPLSRAYAASWRATALLPLATAVVTIDLARRRAMPFRHAVVAFAILAFVTMAWTAFAVEALGQPMLSLIPAVG